MFNYVIAKQNGRKHNMFFKVKHKVKKATEHAHTKQYSDTFTAISQSPQF
jgi:hypothetical protein